MIKLYDFVEEKTGFLSILKCFEILKYKIMICPFYSSRVSFFWVVPWEVNHKKHKGLQKLLNMVYLVEFFALIILVKKFLKSVDK